MGVIISKFRKKKTSVEVLETLENDIRYITDYQRDTEQRHKRIVGQFLVFSIGIYLTSAFLFYFYFFPPGMRERVLYIVPLICAPVMIFSLKKLLTWYYNRKISRNDTRLVDLVNEKKQMLEKIMETETYKVARTILEKYGSSEIKKVVPYPSNELTPIKSANSPVPSDIRSRFPINKGRISFGNTPLKQNIATPNRGFPSMSKPPISQSTQLVPVGAKNTMPRSILPRDRSIVDKMVDYLVGDGPSHRFALICKYCSGHNGMALKEEFEFLSFKCCYCFMLNPSRKKRPLAPKLELTSPTSLDDSTSESEKNSPSDTEEDVDDETKVEVLYSHGKENGNDLESKQSVGDDLDEKVIEEATIEAVEVLEEEKDVALKKTD